MHLAVDCRLIGETGIGTFLENVLHYIVTYTKHDFLLIGNSDKLKCYVALHHCKIIDCRYHSFSIKELLFFPTKEVNLCDAFYTPNFNIPIGIKVPIFSTIHDILFFETEDFASPIHIAALKWYVKRALRISKTIFTVSNFSKERIQQYFHTSADIRVVPNGINRKMQLYRKSHGVSENKSGIVFLGSIKKHKGIHVLLDAYMKLKAINPKCPSLTIVGHVDFRTKDKKILAIIEQSHDGVNFLGAVDDDKLYKILSDAAVLVSPSFYEGFGIPPLEAMYLGTPVIISDIPVYRELYSKLPVTYFKCGDADNLCKELIRFESHKLEISDRIDEMYSYSETANRILLTIESSVNL